MDLTEQWIFIHDEYYEISNLGNLRRAKAGISTFVGRPVMPIINGNGYLMVALSGAKTRRAYVHHLVAEAFLGSRPDGMVINHKDRDRTNNAVDNLEYVSRKENCDHSLRIGVPRRKGPTKPKLPLKGKPRGADHWTAKYPEKIAKGLKMPHCKISAEKVREARSRVAAGTKQNVIATEFGISVAQMSRVIRGTRWKYIV